MPCELYGAGRYGGHFIFFGGKIFLIAYIYLTMEIVSLFWFCFKLQPFWVSDCKNVAHVGIIKIGTFAILGEKSPAHLAKFSMSGSIWVSLYCIGHLHNWTSGREVIVFKKEYILCLLNYDKRRYFLAVILKLS